MSSEAKARVRAQVYENVQEGSIHPNQLGLPGTASKSPTPPMNQDSSVPSPPPRNSPNYVPYEVFPSLPRPFALAAGYDELAHQLALKVISSYDPRGPSASGTVNVPPTANPNQDILDALANLGDRFGNPIPSSSMAINPNANLGGAREKSSSPEIVHEFINLGDSPPPGPSGIFRQPAVQQRSQPFPTVSLTSSSDDSPPPPPKKVKGVFSSFKAKSRKFFKKGPGGKSSEARSLTSDLDVGVLSGGGCYFPISNNEVTVIATRLLTSISMVRFFRHFNINIETFSTNQRYPDCIAALIGWLYSGKWDFYQEFTSHPSTRCFPSNFFSWLHHLRREIMDRHERREEVTGVLQLTSFEEYIRKNRSPDHPINSAQSPFSDQDKMAFAIKHKGLIRSIPFFDDNPVSRQAVHQLATYSARLGSRHLPTLYIPYVTAISAELASLVAYVTYGNRRDFQVALEGCRLNRNCEPAHAGLSFFEWVLYMRELVLQHERLLADGEATADSLELPFITILRPKTDYP